MVAFNSQIGNDSKIPSIIQLTVGATKFTNNSIPTKDGYYYTPKRKPFNVIAYSYYDSITKVPFGKLTIKGPEDKGIVMPYLGQPNMPNENYIIYGMPYFFGKRLYAAFSGNNGQPIQTPLGQGPAWGIRIQK